MIDFVKIFENATKPLAENVDVERGPTLGSTVPGGVAASAEVVVVGSAPSTARLALALASEGSVFEGQRSEAGRAAWAAEEIVGESFGVREAGSSISEGQFLISLAGGILRTIRLEKPLDLADGWYSGAAIDALVGPGALFEDFNPVYAMAKTASLSPYDDVPIEFLEPNPVSALKLDGWYNDIRKGSAVALEYGPLTAGYFVHSVSPADVTVATDVEVPVSRIILANSGDLTPAPAAGITVHFDPRKVGEIEYIPTKTVTLEHIVAISRPVTLASDTALPVTGVPIIIEDAEQTALLATGDIYEDEQGQPRVLITEVTDKSFEGELVKPITFHWGLSTVTRGETVNREVLGSGDATQRWQTFKLAKSPLTYVADPAAPDGRRAELAVYVDGVKWRRAPSFFGAEPGDRIYVIKHDAKHDTHVVFGDGELGARPPTGSKNVVARYRYGVGGNVDARTIKRLTRPVTGVRSVVNPLAASGGEDPPTPAQAREQITQSTRVLGKMVALPDFEVEAKRWGGVVASKAQWAWDKQSDEALVEIWVIAPGPGDPSAKLQSYLQARAEPGTRVRVHKAVPDPFPLSFQLEVEPEYLPDDVIAAMRERLFDETVGFFAPRNANIGGVFRRSELYAELHQIPGVANVRVVSLYGEVPAGYAIPEGTYLAPNFVSLGPNQLL